MTTIKLSNPMYSFLITVITMMTMTTLTTAQSNGAEIQLKNRYRTNNYIKVQNGQVSGGLINGNQQSAIWVIEYIEAPYFRLKKKGTSNQYLNVERGPAVCGYVPPHFSSSHWKKTKVPGTNYYRIENRYREGHYLNMEGPLAASKVPAGYWTSHWSISEVKPPPAPEVYFTIPGTDQKMSTNQLRSELAKGGFTLVQTDKLQPNQCAMVFANADADDISADFGVLMCVTQIGENVTLSSAAVYGGCDASSLNQGMGAKCEIGVGSADLKVLIPGGGETNFDIKGPAANACGAISAEMMCGSVGATLASTSFEITDDNGTGIGFSLEAGVGAGINGGFEDGILSASLNLRFIAGGSISFSINVEDVGEKIIKAGQSGYVLVEKGMVAASTELAKVFVRDIAPHILVATNTVVASFEQTGKDMVEFFEGDFMDVMTDVDQFFQQAGKEIIYVFNGRKISRPLKPGEGYLSIFNQAGYITKVALVYVHNGQVKSSVKDISAGMTEEYYLPAGSTAITIAVQGVGTFDRESLVKTFPNTQNLVKAYKFYGTIFDVAYAEINPYR